MRLLYLDCIGGIAGDMTVAALLGLGVPLETLREGLARLNIPGLIISTEPAARHHIAGMRFLVQHAESGGHTHRAYADIRALLQGAALPGRSGELAQAVFARLAEAEGEVHGRPADEVTFHEVGAWDSIADIVCTAIAVDSLAVDAVYCSPVPVGEGMVRTAHGAMPVPAPATLLLLRGFALEQGPPPFERTTPTGAAILAALARPAPPTLRYTPERVGIGVGSKDPPEVPNILRAVLGTSNEVGLPAASAAHTERIEVAEVNLDDANPEWIGYLMERLFAAGALDAVLLPIQMKKGRPGTQVQVLYPPALREAVQAVLFRESTTLGVRHYSAERTVLAREPASVTTPWGAVSGKVGSFGGQRRFAPEYESCRRVALAAGVPLRDVYRAAEAAFAAGP